jgi:hypothetical protein
MSESFRSEWETAYHCEINALLILESIEQSNQPFAVGCREDVAFCQDVSNLVQLKEQLLAHDFQGTDFAGVFLLSKIDLPVSTLSNLSENLKVAVSESRPAFS